MDKAIKILVDEHKNILKLADALEKECNKIKSGEKVNEDFFKKVIDFIRNYADKFHHAKEEDILFKEFCKTAEKGCLHCNPVEQMLYEHDIGRKFVRGIEEGIKEKDKRKIVENSLGYVNLIREHIFKEDNILYPMAENSFDKRTKEEILKKFNKISKDKKIEERKYFLFVRGLN
ncbi:MAG: hemerythrin domain-containing protein [Candidatus Pacearchaeota archaeon]